MSATPPDVSVVIPTLHRPRLVLRALRSVFAQTWQRFEVIVVVDGPDAATVAALGSVADPRLRVLVNAQSLTAAGARNAGVAQARGRWIAFLDDDDEWLPTKLERQLQAAGASAPALVTSLSRVVTPRATYVWPTRIFDNARPLGEYLFDRRSTFAGASFMQTSSYLIPRALFEQSPFRTDTPHDDWDFLLRLVALSGGRVETVPEILVNVYFEDEARPSLSRTGTWAASLAWLDSVRPLLTRRAYSGFCLSVVGSRAANEQAYRAVPLLLRKAFAQGAPRLSHLLPFVAFWIFPQHVRRRLRAALAGRRAAPAQPA
jgi:glycosyltransferase involved in cell wall biosynthesis